MYGIDWEGPMADDHDMVAESITVPETTNPLTEEQSQELLANIDPLKQCDNYGINIYLETLEFVHTKLET